MTPKMYLDRFSDWETPKFKEWKLGWQSFENKDNREGFSYNSDLDKQKWLGDLTTTCVLDNGLLAKFMEVDGPFKMANGEWKNVNNARNLILIQNSWEIAREIFSGGYEGINIPQPFGLTHITKNPTGEIYPAFVMKYFHNEFPELNDKQKCRVLKKRDKMLVLAEQKGFDTFLGTHNPNNVLYSNGMVYVIGFGLWKKK